MAIDLYTSNLDELNGYINELWNEDQEKKNELVNQWRINVHFANGNQNPGINGVGTTVSVNNGNVFLNSIKQNKRNLYETNEIAPVIRTLVSYLNRSKPSVDVFSASDDDLVGRKKAEVARAVLDAKYDIDDEYNNSRIAAFWALTTGTVFRKDYWDSSRGPRVYIPKFDALGNEVLDTATGDVIYESAEPSGDSRVAIIPPFNISFDWSCADYDDLEWIQESYLLPVETARKMFGGDGFIGDAAAISDGDGLVKKSNALLTLESLKYASKTNYSTKFDSHQKGKCLVREMYIRPSESHPEGRLVIQVGDQIFFDGPSPYFMPYEPVGWHPYTPYVYQPFIGRLLGRSLVEDVLGIQMRINKLNEIFIENSETVGIPRIICAEDQLRRGSVRGDGQTITTYRIIPGAPMPQPWMGVALPSQFFNEKNAIIDQLVRIVGTNFAMQGQTPAGVSAAAAIGMLLENASNQQSDAVKSWERFHEQGFLKKLRLIRKFADRPNQQLVDRLRMYARDALIGDLKAFTRDDLSDGIYVKIDAGSMLPKQEIARREIYKELLGMGFFPVVAEDSPRGVKLRKELLRRFGEKPFDDDQNVDLEKAEWENSQMKNGQPPFFWEKDNHPIHLMALENEMKRPEFIERATDEVKAAFLNHYAKHESALNELTQNMEQPAEQPIDNNSGQIPENVETGIETVQNELVTDQQADQSVDLPG